MQDPKTDWRPPDILSATARHALEGNSPAAYTRLVVRGRGWPEAKAALGRLRPEQLLTRPVRSPDDAQCLLSGLWLWHDWLDESHTISQAVHTPSGSFWHAIMHRREGDFSNAKYWYARCRNHPALESIAVRADSALSGLGAVPTLRRSTAGGWDSDHFVDVVEAVHRKGDDPLYPTVVMLQRIEWQALFDYCASEA